MVLSKQNFNQAIVAVKT